MSNGSVNETLFQAIPSTSFSVSNDLKKIGVCIRCIMRFNGICDHTLYLLSTDDLIATWNAIAKQNEVNDDIVHEGVCTCCLDVFETALGTNGREKLSILLQSSGYVTSTFMITIKIPSATLIRQYSLGQHVQYKKTPVDLKEVLKWCLTPIISTMLSNATYIATSDLSINLKFHHENSEDEAMQLPSIRETIIQNKKRKLDIDGFGAISRALQASTIPSSLMQCPPQLATSSTLNLTIERSPTYLSGRYLKYQRGLSQTPWVVEGDRLGESSVEESIGDIVLPHFQAKSYKFHTAGREDVDVRMLGNGRPFILELLDAKLTTLPSPDDYKRIQDEVNTKNEDKIEIRDLISTTKETFASLQSGADSKRKTYCCVVWVADKLTPERVAILNNLKDLQVAQRTPVRVLHRRTLMTRPKIIHDATCTVLNNHYMLLRLTTSAGTYVKEFVHGDLGRTFPNVSSLLGCDADILQLDVENLLE